MMLQVRDLDRVQLGWVILLLHEVLTEVSQVQLVWS